VNASRQRYKKVKPALKHQGVKQFVLYFTFCNEREQKGHPWEHLLVNMMDKNENL